MRSPNLKKWDYSHELEGLLLFAQSLDELLFDHTVDTYKATALNLRTSAFEIWHYANELLNNRIRLRALDPLIDELMFRLQNDPVVNYFGIEVFSQYCRQLQQAKTKPYDLVNVSAALISELDLYWDSILKIIPKVIAQPDGAINIRSIATVFIAEAEQNRFSREYQYFKTNEFFFSDGDEPERIKQVTQIEDFLNIFRAKSSDWRVFLQGSGPIDRLMKNSEIWDKKIDIKISKGTPDDLAERYKTDTFFTKNYNYPFVIQIELSSKAWNIKEPVMAKQYARMNMSTVSDIFSFVTHEEKIKLSEKTLVINNKDESVSAFDGAKNPMKKGIKRVDDMEVINRMKFFIPSYFGNQFEPKSTVQFISSFAFHKYALDTNNVESQLANLWTSVESFLPPPSEESARIESYLNAILPVQTLTYSRKIFEYLFESIKHSTSKIYKLIESFQIPGDISNKIIALVTVDDYKDKRDLVLVQLEKEPLLRNRIIELSNSFSSKKQIKSGILAHRQRVTWHTQRIYTLRNEIVHSGRRLPYTSTLIENLHSYYDSLVETVSIIASFSRDIYDIASIMALLSVHEKRYLQSLDGKDEPCTQDNFRDLIFGHDNPINPFNTSISLGSAINRSS